MKIKIHKVKGLASLAANRQKQKTTKGSIMNWVPLATECDFLKKINRPRDLSFAVQIVKVITKTVSGDIKSWQSTDVVYCFGLKEVMEHNERADLLVSWLDATS